MIRVLIGPVLDLSLSVAPAYAWTEYKNDRYIDFDGDLVNEIIIESKQGAGSNHYVEDMRIFKDKYPALDLIFSIRTRDSTYGFKPPSQYNRDIISTVEVTEQAPENNGVRDIVVRSRKVFYKDGENKIKDREEDLGSKTFKWNGAVYQEAVSR